VARDEAGAASSPIGRFASLFGARNFPDRRSGNALQGLDAGGFFGIVRGPGAIFPACRELRDAARRIAFDDAGRAKRAIVRSSIFSGTTARMNNPKSDLPDDQPDGGKPVVAKPVVVKKYANRRLYNTATSSYVTLDDLARMIKDGGDFVVKDARTGEDLTRSVLTQIIVEQEQKGQNLLPISFLRQLISFYGDNMQFLVPGYLEQAMIAFARNQEQMRSNLRATFGMFPFGQFEEIGKQNMAMFERALRMLSPASREAAGPAEAEPTGQSGTGEPSKPGSEDPRLRRLEAQIEALRLQLEALGRGRDEG
jgi:polyhydroxyalkanoate synthesis repressor PhaR